MKGGQLFNTGLRKLIPLLIMQLGRPVIFVEICVFSYRVYVMRVIIYAERFIQDGLRYYLQIRTLVSVHYKCSIALHIDGFSYHCSSPPNASPRAHD